MHFLNRALRLAAIVTMLFAVTVLPASAGVVYDQPWDGGSNLFASQNDTNGFGNYATVYDNFTLGSTTFLGRVTWVGGYFNPPEPGSITGWTVQIWNTVGGQPGSSLFSEHISGTGNETFIANVNGFPIYSYTADFFFVAQAGTEYWLSVVPDVGFPPQWGWATGTGGDGIAFQDFFGTRSELFNDMAFSLEGPCSCVPEPASLILLGTGVFALGRVIRKKR